MEGRAPASASLGGPLILAALFVALAWWSWLRWADVWIDFGAELYIPWRLVAGDTLYGDIAYRNGPLSPWLNALWFRLFGVSVRTLVLCNLALMAAACATLWTFFRRTVGPLAASGAAVFFLCGFGFAHLVGIGNFNWVTPYQHSQTHGVWLGMGLALASSVVLERRSALASVATGAALGLVFLTKVELFAAAAAAFAVGVAILAGASPRDAARHLAIALGAAAAPILVAAGLLASELGPRDAWAGLVGNWRYLGADLVGDAFYRHGLGVDAPARNALAMVRATAVLLAFAGIAAAADRLLSPRAGSAPSIAVGGATFLGLLLIDPATWLDLARALPLTTAAMGAFFAVRAWREPRDPARSGALCVWATLSLVLLGKMLLHARIQHYGFALAMPASALLIAALLGMLPRGLEARRPGAGHVARAVAVGALAASLVAVLGISREQYARKTRVVGSGADRLLARPAWGDLANATLARLEPQLGERDTLLVLPEGVGINYWLRRRTPTRHFLFLPTELEAHGQDVILAELRESPPNLVVFVERSFEEFGTGPFGSEPRAGAPIAGWVEEAYPRLTPDGLRGLAAPGLQVAIYGPQSALSGRSPAPGDPPPPTDPAPPRR